MYIIACLSKHLVSSYDLSTFILSSETVDYVIQGVLSTQLLSSNRDKSRIIHLSKNICLIFVS